MLVFIVYGQKENKMIFVIKDKAGERPRIAFVRRLGGVPQEILPIFGGILDFSLAPVQNFAGGSLWIRCCFVPSE
jgi:hypothetical protein